MAITETHIANRAMRLLGQARIGSITSNEPAAQVINEAYDMCREETLRAFPWNFATLRAELGQDATTPVYGYSYRYTLPSDCLFVQEAEGDPQYVIEGGYLLTNETSINIKYTRDMENPNDYDAVFVAAFAARIAAEVALPITKSTALLEAMWTMYRNLLDSASTIDAQENHEEKPEKSTWLEARGLSDGSQRAKIIQQS